MEEGSVLDDVASSTATGRLILRRAEAWPLDGGLLSLGDVREASTSGRVASVQASAPYSVKY